MWHSRGIWHEQRVLVVIAVISEDWCHILIAHPRNFVKNGEGACAGRYTVICIVACTLLAQAGACTVHA